MENIVLNVKGALNYGVSPARPRTAICPRCDTGFLETNPEPKRASKEMCFRCTKRAKFPDLL